KGPGGVAEIEGLSAEAVQHRVLDPGVERDVADPDLGRERPRGAAIDPLEEDLDPGAELEPGGAARGGGLSGSFADDPRRPSEPAFEVRRDRHAESIGEPVPADRRADRD